MTTTPPAAPAKLSAILAKVAPTTESGKPTALVSAAFVRGIAGQVADLESSLSSAEADLSAVLDLVRLGGVSIERREGGGGWACTNEKARAAEARAALLEGALEHVAKNACVNNPDESADGMTCIEAGDLPADRCSSRTAKAALSAPEKLSEVIGRITHAFSDEHRRSIVREALAIETRLASALEAIAAARAVGVAIEPRGDGWAVTNTRAERLEARLTDGKPLVEHDALHIRYVCDGCNRTLQVPKAALSAPPAEGKDDDPPHCTVCGLRKKPIGRDSMDNGLCDRDCSGYNLEPHAGYLWPGEERKAEVKPDATARALNDVLAAARRRAGFPPDAPAVVCMCGDLWPCKAARSPATSARPDPVGELLTARREIERLYRENCALRAEKAQRMDAALAAVQATPPASAGGATAECDCPAHHGLECVCSGCKGAWPQRPVCSSPGAKGET